MRRLILVPAIVAGFLFMGLTPAASTGAETVDVLDQGGATIYASHGARMVRQVNGISVAVKMPTPEPRTYTYPDGTSPGHPEGFTLWMFVFNHPERCSGSCGPDDMTNPAVGFGVYNPAGHFSGGGILNLAGRVGVGEPAGAPPGVTPHPLSNPAGAEVHLAVTSHGSVDPATLPGELRRPTGSGACGCWWLAIFD